MESHNRKYTAPPLSRLHMRSYRLPACLENICAPLPAESQEVVREALVEALVDAEVPPRAYRTDSVVSSGYSFWAIPAPDLAVLAEKLTAATFAGVTKGKWEFAVALSGFVYRVLASIAVRAELSSHQAVVLRCLKKAPKTSGWTLAEVALQIPAEAELSERDVEDVVAELRTLLDVTGKPATWTVHQRDGHMWTSGV